MATKVSSGEITIVDVNDGGSFYTATVYAQQVGQPDTPTGGTYDFSTQALTVPTDPNPATNPSTGATIWSSSIPTSTTTPTWAATYTFSTIPPNTSSTGGTWGTPVLFVVNGTNGSNGANAISVILSNEAATLPATSTGVVGSYTGSGTNVYVYEGASQLSYDGVGTSAGTWTVTSSATNITRGSLTDSGTYLTVGDHSAMTNNIDTASIAYTITGKSTSNTSFTIVKSQTFSKSKAGTDGSSGLGSTVSITANREVSFTATDGTIDTGQADIVFTANTINMTSPTYVWSFSGFQTAPTNSGTSSQTVTAAQFGTSKSAKVTITVTYNSQTYTDDYTIVRLEKSTAAAGADVTNYSDTRVANALANSGGTTIQHPGGGYFASDYPSLTGAIQIKLPQGYTNTMMSFFVDVYDYSQDKSFSLQITGYNYAATSSWYNVSANLIGSTSANNRVRFGADASKCIIWIGETTSSWSYIKVSIRDLVVGYSNYAVSQWSDGWNISLVTSGINYVNQDIADSLIDANAIKNQGAFATLNQVTSANASTYIANAAIGSAQIGSINLTGNFNVKSATTGARMEMDAQVIKVYDANNVLRVKLGNLGA